MTVLATMRWDVARSLIHLALDLPELTERDSGFEDDTLGWLLGNVLSMHFPGQSVQELRKLRDGNAGHFEMMIQQAARVLG